MDTSNSYKCLVDKLYEKDINYLLTTLTPENTPEQRAVGVKNVYFKPGDIVTIRIECNDTSDNVLLHNREECKQILETFAFPHINLNFEWVEDEIAIPNIRIIMANNLNIGVGGATAGIGTQNSIIYIFDISQGTILHEFAHALGRYHEFLNPVNNPIKWIKDKVYEYYKNTSGLTTEQVDAQIFKKLDLSETLVTPFDKDSIMNYDIVPYINEDGISVHRGNSYSLDDKKWFELQYGLKT